MPNPDAAGNLRTFFFETDDFPEARFESTGVTAAADSTYVLVGDLTLKGITRSTEWTVRFNGFGIYPQGAPGFTAQGELDRLEFEVGGHELIMDSEIPVVARTVFVTFNVRLDYIHEE